MKTHICFETVDCERLQYVEPSRSWVCLNGFFDLKTVDTCMKCKFDRLRVLENELRKCKNG